MYRSRDANTSHRLDFDLVNKTALPALERLCRRWLPEGHREGSEWVCGDLSGKPGRSLRVRLTGPKAGVWRDFAEGVGGSDPVSLAAAVAGISQGEAGRGLAEMLGVRHG